MALQTSSTTVTVSFVVLTFTYVYMVPQGNMGTAVVMIILCVLIPDTIGAFLWVRADNRFGWSEVAFCGRRLQNHGRL